MNKLAFALAITTVVFASTTIYFAGALHRERERAVHPLAMRVAEKHDPEAAMPGNLLAATRPADPGSATAQSPPPARAPGKAEQIALSQAGLNRLIDPQSRAEHLVNLKNMLRANLYGVAKGVGLSGDEQELLVTLLAEQSLRRAESRLRCEVTPGCVPEPDPAAGKEAERLEMVQLLGEEKVARFQAYIDASFERSVVERLRPRLSEAGQVSDAQAERLVGVLAEERRHVMEGAKTEGTDVTPHSISGHVLAVGDIRTAEGRTRQLESVTEYIRRVHDRAAQILTPRQLTAFDELQDEELRQVRESLTFRELAAPARAGK